MPSSAFSIPSLYSAHFTLLRLKRRRKGTSDFVIAWLIVTEIGHETQVRVVSSSPEAAVEGFAIFGAAQLHVKSMQRRGQTRIRSDGAHEAVDAARITRLRRLNGAALNARVPFFQLERQIHVTRSRGSQSAVRISAAVTDVQPHNISR